MRILEINQKKYLFCTYIKKLLNIWTTNKAYFWCNPNLHFSNTFCTGCINMNRICSWQPFRKSTKQYLISYIHVFLGTARLFPRPLRWWDSRKEDMETVETSSRVKFAPPPQFTIYLRRSVQTRYCFIEWSGNHAWVYSYHVDKFFQHCCANESRT